MSLIYFFKFLFSFWKFCILFIFCKNFKITLSSNSLLCMVWWALAAWLWSENSTKAYGSFRPWKARFSRDMEAFQPQRWSWFWWRLRFGWRGQTGTLQWWLGPDFRRTCEIQFFLIIIFWSLWFSKHDWNNFRRFSCKKTEKKFLIYFLEKYLKKNDFLYFHTFFINYSCFWYLKKFCKTYRVRGSSLTLPRWNPSRSATFECRRGLYEPWPPSLA